MAVTQAVPENIPSVLHWAAREFGSIEALVDEKERYTYASLEIAVQRVARALIASGVQAGDRVSIWAPNSATWLLTSLGIYAAGAIMVPVMLSSLGIAWI